MFLYDGLLLVVVYLGELWELPLYPLHLLQPLALQSGSRAVPSTHIVTPLRHVTPLWSEQQP